MTQYTATKDGSKVSDEHVKQWIMDTLEGEDSAYGYLKLTYLAKCPSFLQRTWHSEAAAPNKVEAHKKTRQEP